MYTITSKYENSLHKLYLFNELTGETITILPEYGSNISEIILKKGEELIPIIDGNKSKDEMYGKALFKGAKLIPFVNRINNGKYNFNNQLYQLALNYPEEGNACHGFVYEKPFELVEEYVSKTYSSVKLRYIHQGKTQGYPFKFNVIVTLSLSNSGFEYRTNIKNTDFTPIPMSDGWHPFFKFDSKIDDQYLELGAEYAINYGSQMKDFHFIENKNFRKFDRINSTIMDNCYLVGGNNGKCHTRILDKEREAVIELWQETGPNKYNFIQVYTPPHRQSIAIEPQTSTANSFNTGFGLITLEPGQSIELVCGVSLYSLNKYNSNT